MCYSEISQSRRYSIINTNIGSPSSPLFVAVTTKSQYYQNNYQFDLRLHWILSHILRHLYSYGVRYSLFISVAWFIIFPPALLVAAVPVRVKNAVAPLVMFQHSKVQLRCCRWCLWCWCNCYKWNRRYLIGYVNSSRWIDPLLLRLSEIDGVTHIYSCWITSVRDD